MEDLIKCDDFEAFTKLIMHKDIVQLVNERHPRCNPRDLLSSGLICKFPDIVHATPDVIVHSERVFSKITHNEPVEPSDEYFSTFRKWKTEDAQKIQAEITEGVQMLQGLVVDAKDEADDEWNKGVEKSIQHISQCSSALFSSSAEHRCFLENLMTAQRDSHLEQQQAWHREPPCEPFEHEDNTS